LCGMMKGIVLAGGYGTRLHPLTRATSKHLLPVYDKPMVYYPLATLMLGGIRDILLVSTPQDLPVYEQLLGTGAQWGVRIQYAAQEKPGGLAEAFLVGREFVGRDPVTLILGDNVFHGEGFARMLQTSIQENGGATVFGSFVSDPERYGVAAFDVAGDVVGIEEKPVHPKSNWAVAGLYVYDNSVLDIAASLKPSARGELEITDVNNEYLRRSKLKLVKFSRGTAWLDMGTHDSLLDAANYIAAMQKRQGLQVACLEEVAFRMGFIDADALAKLAEAAKVPEQRKYLQGVLQAGA